MLHGMAKMRECIPPIAKFYFYYTLIARGQIKSFPNSVLCTIFIIGEQFCLVLKSCTPYIPSQ